MGESSELAVAFGVSILLLFLSSALNPGLYLWSMNDIRNGVKQLFHCEITTKERGLDLI